MKHWIQPVRRAHYSCQTPNNIKTEEEKLVHLTGVWVLPAGIWGLTGGGAVCRGGGGWQRLSAGVRSLAELVSTDPSRTGGRTVGLLRDGEGWLRELLWRTLLVQLHGFTDCTQSKHTRVEKTLITSTQIRLFLPAASLCFNNTGHFKNSSPEVESTLLSRRGGPRMLGNRGFFIFSSPSFSGLMLFCLFKTTYWLEEQNFRQISKTWLIIHHTVILQNHFVQLNYSNQTTKINYFKFLFYV